MEERKRANDQRFESQEKAVILQLQAAKDSTAAALAASDKAVEKAERAQLAVNATQNEFRGTLKDQQSTLMTKSEADARIKSIEEKIAALDSWKNQASGKSAGANWLWALIAGFAGLAIAALSVINALHK